MLPWQFGDNFEIGLSTCNGGLAIEDYYPRLHGRRVQYFVCLFVCVCVFVCMLPQNGCKIQLSQNLNKLHLTNLVILDKQWFSTRQASSYRQTRLKWQVKLKTKN